MKILISAAIAALLTTTAFTSAAATVDVTPLPAHITDASGEMIITPATTLVIEAPQDDAQRLRRYIDTEWRHFPAYAGKKTSRIQLLTVGHIDGVDSPEGYRLSVTPDATTIEATSGAGLFYGLQTLIQLADGTDTITAVDITDSPRFGYRGMMLDISRHYRDKKFILKQIDALARLKINRLHLHLTDAAGWRIEIKRYPRLTEYAAWRPELTWKEWTDGGARYAEATDFNAHGGFLTQDDAREIVRYAADRYITVIPEIEMPSHSEELTATFPEISCTHNPKGEPDVCVGNEQTFEILQNILDEVMDIFPSEYIHIGGDEASKKAWKECDLCHQRMTQEGLKDVDQLQSYLIHRIEQHLNSKGRSLIGWDEIMEGGLAPNATVMSWRGTEGGIKAARSGHQAVMSPGGYCYLDSYQDAPATQPVAISGYLPLQRVYSYDPAPDSLGIDVTRWITGIQGNLWTEYVPTAQHAEYMLWPRMIAIAEIGWTPQALRSWESFRPRALKVADHMQSDGYTVFDLRGEAGNRRQSTRPAEHLAKGKKVTYNVPWWSNYNAAGEATLTDGLRGGWSYGDGRWQGFLHRGDQRVDVTIDLEKPTDITYVGADFMQITGPGVWFPAKVEISVSDDGKNFTTLTTIEHKQKDSTGLSFKEFSWSGTARARYVRYCATSTEGCQFTDEIIIR